MGSVPLIFFKDKTENGSHRGFRFFVRDPLLSPRVGGRRIKKWGNIWYFPHLFVSFTYGEDRLHFGNKRKKSTFSLYFTQFALSLQREMKKILL